MQQLKQTLAVIMPFILAACGGGGGGGGGTATSNVIDTPTPNTRTDVRIGINDSGVDINHSQFLNRIEATGANFTAISTLSTPHSEPTNVFFMPTSSSGSTCTTQADNLCLFINGNTTGTTDLATDSPYYIADLNNVPLECDGAAGVQACARAMLLYASDNIPTDPSPNDPNDSTKIDKVFGSDDVDRDLTLTIYDKANDITYHLPTADFIDHGTIVASIAATNAPGASIVPIFEQRLVGSSPLFNSNYDNVDIVNRSYGIDRLPDGTDESLLLDLVDPYRNATVGTNTRALWEREAQIDVPSANKTVVVWAAGNINTNLYSQDSYYFNNANIIVGPGLEAALPYYYLELRDHWVAVVATNNVNAIANYSFFCGDLPSDWDAAAHGRHYCLAALGTATGAALPNEGTATSGLQGTSFAAPRVAGAIAHLMLNARNQISAVEALSRIKETAFNSDCSSTSTDLTNCAEAASVDYSDSYIYGAGLLDPDEALVAVGTTSVSAANGLQSSVQASVLRTHPAYGAAVINGLRGLEVAAFDELNYPFWYSASAMVDATVAPLTPLWQRMDETHAVLEQAGLMKTLRWNHVTSDAYGALRLAITDNTLGFSSAPFSGDQGALAALRLGLLLENDAQYGTRSSGAFDSKVNSGLAFAGFEHTLGALEYPWTLYSRAMFAAGKTDHEDGALFAASGSVYSSASLTLQYAKGNSRSRFHIEQPLRAETGEGTLHYAYARTLDGAPLYRKHQFSLVPKARAIHLGLRHDRTIAHGRFAVELLHIINHGHVSGESDSQISMAYQLDW